MMFHLIFNKETYEERHKLNKRMYGLLQTNNAIALEGIIACALGIGVGLYDLRLGSILLIVGLTKYFLIRNANYKAKEYRKNQKTE
jgi:hypothetical protein